MTSRSQAREISYNFNTHLVCASKQEIALKACTSVACVRMLPWKHLLFLIMCDCCCGDWNKLNLPVKHIPYFFTNNQDIKEKCSEDLECPYKDQINVSNCWGYEKQCPLNERLGNPRCPEDSRGWADTKTSQLSEFWKAADFGYIQERRKELKVFCKPESESDSLLECVKYARYCRAKNIFMDFTKAKLKEGRDRFREDVFKDGDIGGHCKLDKKALQAESEHKSPLQSWYAEVEHFTSLPFRPIDDKNCDIIIDKPTYLIKLDAGVNLYHHFCDFINLYTSQHVNNTFNTDVYIVMWDTSPLTYTDLFADVWKMFTDYPVISLKEYDGKKVCFKDAVFSLLARMRYGLYYNMPLIPGCYDSSLFQAFNEHLVHRLALNQKGPLKEKIRVTLLSRSTKYRQILNQKELVDVMKTVGELEVRVVDYQWKKISFKDQMEISHNSDIFIGMHGAGLTHMLFQPDWAVVMEIYNCEDDTCYYDLARLRGIKYMTWEKKSKLHQQDEGHHPTLGAHAKFTNYGFDVMEFMRLVYKAMDYVREHPKFVRDRQTRHRVKDEL